MKSENSSNLYLATLRNNEDRDEIVVNKFTDSSNPVELAIPVILYGKKYTQQENICYFFDILTGMRIYDGRNYDLFPVNGPCFESLIPLTKNDIIKYSDFFKELTEEQIEEYLQKLKENAAVTYEEYQKYDTARQNLLTTLIKKKIY